MAIKIDQKIIDYSVKSLKKETDNKIVELTPQRELMHEEVKRPEELKGYTYKIKTPLSDHALYITINNIVLNMGTEHEQEYPFEVFINSKNMEHFQWVLALTRVISAVFRKGGDATFLVEELKQVFDPQGGYFKKGGRFMPSLVADIGHVLETHLTKMGLIQKEELSESHQALIAEKKAAMEKSNNSVTEEQAETDEACFPTGSQLCIKCSVQAMVLLDGCMTCLNCGESKCN